MSEQALVECKTTAGLDRLEWFAKRVAMRGVSIRVTIRFAVYDDYQLVKQIETILREHTRWEITLDGSNKPTIAPDGRFKVMFESGIGGDFNEVAFAFGYGRLITGSIGHRAADRATDGHLIVEIIPTLKQ